MTDHDIIKSLPADPGDILRPALDEGTGKPAAVPSEAPALCFVPNAEPVAAEPSPAEPSPVEPSPAEIAPAASAPKRKVSIAALGIGATAICAAAATACAAVARHARTGPATIAGHPKAALAAGVALAALIGFGGGRLGGSARADLEAQRWGEATLALRQSQDEVTRLAGEVRNVRGQVEAMRSDRQRTDVPARIAQTGDRLEKTLTDHTSRLTKLTEQVERMEKAQRDPARIAGIVERLDRIERQTQTVAEKVATPVPPAKPAAMAAAAGASDVTQTGSVAPAQPKAAPEQKVAALDKAPEADPRKVSLDGYVLRDVGDGVALIESRAGRLIEVRPGTALAGGNKVEAIERRGRQWVVVTQKGFIGSERW